MTDVKITVHNILGLEVITLVNKIQEPGRYKVELNASDLSSVTYIYRIKANEFVQTKKLLLMK